MATVIPFSSQPDMTAYQNLPMNKKQSYLNHLKKQKDHNQDLYTKLIAKEESLIELLPKNEYLKFKREQMVLTKWKKRLDDWEKVENIIKTQVNSNMNEKTKKKLNSNQKDVLMMSRTDEYRIVSETYDLIQLSVPMQEKHSETFWERGLRGGGSRRIPIGVSGLTCIIEKEHSTKPPKIVRKPNSIANKISNTSRSRTMSIFDKTNEYIEKSKTVDIHRRTALSQLSALEVATKQFLPSEDDINALCIRAINLYDWAYVTTENFLLYGDAHEKDYESSQSTDMQYPSITQATGILGLPGKVDTYHSVYSRPSTANSNKPETEEDDTEVPTLEWPNDLEMVLSCLPNESAHTVVHLHNPSSFVIQYSFLPVPKTNVYDDNHDIDNMSPAVQQNQTENIAIEDVNPNHMNLDSISTSEMSTAAVISGPGITREVDLILKRNFFHCYKTSGSLLPGQSTSVSFTFAHQGGVEGVLNQSYELHTIPKVNLLFNGSDQSIATIYQKLNPPSIHSSPIVQSPLTFHLRGIALKQDIFRINRDEIQSSINDLCIADWIRDEINSCIHRVRTPVTKSILKARIQQLFNSLNIDIVNTLIQSKSSTLTLPLSLPSMQLEKSVEIKSFENPIYFTMKRYKDLMKYSENVVESIQSLIATYNEVYEQHIEAENDWNNYLVAKKLRLADEAIAEAERDVNNTQATAASIAASLNGGVKPNNDDEEEIDEYVMILLPKTQDLIDQHNVISMRNISIVDEVQAKIFPETTIEIFDEVDEDDVKVMWTMSTAQLINDAQYAINIEINTSKAKRQIQYLKGKLAAAIEKDEDDEYVTDDDEDDEAEDDDKKDEEPKDEEEEEDIVDDYTAELFTSNSVGHRLLNLIASYVLILASPECALLEFEYDADKFSLTAVKSNTTAAVAVSETEAVTAVVVSTAEEHSTLHKLISSHISEAFSHADDWSRTCRELALLPKDISIAPVGTTLGNPFLNEKSATDWETLLHPPTTDATTAETTNKDKKSVPKNKKVPAAQKGVATEQQCLTYYKSLYDTIYHELMNNVLNGLTTVDETFDAEYRNINTLSVVTNDETTPKTVYKQDVIFEAPALRESDVESGFAVVNFNFKTFYSDTPQSTLGVYSDTKTADTSNPAAADIGAIPVEDDPSKVSISTSLYEEVNDRVQEEALLPIVEAIAYGVTTVVCLCEFTPPAALTASAAVTVSEDEHNKSHTSAEQSITNAEEVKDTTKELKQSIELLNEKLQDMFDRLDTIRRQAAAVVKAQIKEAKAKSKAEARAQRLAAREAELEAEKAMAAAKDKKFRMRRATVKQWDDEDEQEESDDDEEEEEFFKTIKVVSINSLAEMKAIVLMNNELNSLYLDKLPTECMRADQVVYVYIMNMLSPDAVPAIPPLSPVIYTDDDIDIDIGQDEVDNQRIKEWYALQHKVNVTLTATSHLPKDSHGNDQDVVVDCYCNRYLALQEIITHVADFTCYPVLWIEANPNQFFYSTLNSQSQQVQNFDTKDKFNLSQCLVNMHSNTIKVVVSTVIRKYLSWCSSVHCLSASSPWSASTATLSNKQNVQFQLVQKLLSNESNMEINSVPAGESLNSSLHADFIFILGGTLSFEKLQVINTMLHLSKVIILTGEIALPFLELTEKISFIRHQSLKQYHSLCLQLITKIKLMGIQFILPIDLKVGTTRILNETREFALFEYDEGHVDAGEKYFGNVFTYDLIEHKIISIIKKKVSPTFVVVETPPQVEVVIPAAQAGKTKDNKGGKNNHNKDAPAVAVIAPPPVVVTPPAVTEPIKPEKTSPSTDSIVFEYVYDIGDKTIQLINDIILSHQTHPQVCVVWGVAGVIESASFQNGTRGILHSIQQKTNDKLITWLVGECVNEWCNRILNPSLTTTVSSPAPAPSTVPVAVVQQTAAPVIDSLKKSPAPTTAVITTAEAAKDEVNSNQSSKRVFAHDVFSYTSSSSTLFQSVFKHSDTAARSLTVLHSHCRLMKDTELNLLYNSLIIPTIEEEKEVAVEALDISMATTDTAPVAAATPATSAVTTTSAPIIKKK